MRERPILFSGPMVRAILEGRKTQTRRVVKLSPRIPTSASERDLLDGLTPCPYGQPGYLLWVRETWTCADVPKKRRLEAVQYRATCEYELGPYLRWRPSIFMPKWAARIWLEVTGVRVERLQDISEEDAVAEGVEPYAHIGADQRVPGPGFDGSLLRDQPHRLPFADLWERINGDGAWDANPWVWVIEFKRVERKVVAA